MCLPYDPAITVLGTRPRETTTDSHEDSIIQNFVQHRKELETAQMSAGRRTWDIFLQWDTAQQQKEWASDTCSNMGNLKSTVWVTFI